MKTAIIIADGIKQIMFTAENKSERQALKMITPQDDISVETYEGTLYDNAPESAKGYCVSKCQAGYLRAYQDRENSLMLVLKPKPNENTSSK